MQNVRLPSELARGVDGTAGKENNAFVIVGTVCADIVHIILKFLEIIVVVDEINLNARGLHRSHFYNERMIGVFDRNVDSAETYHLVQLVAAFVDVAEIGHEGSDFILLAMHSYRKISA